LLDTGLSLSFKAFVKAWVGFVSRILRVLWGRHQDFHGGLMLREGFLLNYHVSMIIGSHLSQAVKTGIFGEKQDTGVILVRCVLNALKAFPGGYQIPSTPTRMVKAGQICAVIDTIELILVLGTVQETFGDQNLSMEVRMWVLILKGVIYQEFVGPPLLHLRSPLLLLR
jgi:hypothetical protein